MTGRTPRATVHRKAAAEVGRKLLRMTPCVIGTKYQEPTPMPAGPTYTVADALASALIAGLLPRHPKMGYKAEAWLGKDPDLGSPLSHTEGSYLYYPAMSLPASEVAALLEWCGNNGIASAATAMRKVWKVWKAFRLGDAYEAHIFQAKLDAELPAIVRVIQSWMPGDQLVVAEYSITHRFGSAAGASN